jgi:hypothetical protein
MRIETVNSEKYNQEGATACRQASEGLVSSCALTITGDLQYSYLSLLIELAVFDTYYLMA